MADNSFPLCITFLFVAAVLGVCHGIQLYALFNMEGLAGTVTFARDPVSKQVIVTANLNTFRDPSNYSWYISSNLVSYADQDRCNRKSLGNKIVDLTAAYGQLSIPTSEDVTFQKADGEEDETTKGITFYGRTDSIWEKSLVLEGPGVTACGNILSLEPVRMSEAKFTNVVAGSVVFRRLLTPPEEGAGGTSISVDLFHVGADNAPSSVHRWQILVTDILDPRSRDRQHGFCDHLTVLYDPDNVDDANCTSTGDDALCKKGDLMAKHGTIPVGNRRSRFSRKSYFDTALTFPDLEGSRYLYVAIYRSDDANSLWTCAKISDVRPKETHALLGAKGVMGLISFRQTSPVDPTHVTVNFTNLQSNAAYYHIHLNPVPVRLAFDEAICGAAGAHFNPFRIMAAQSPAPGNGTFDQYEVGDLSGKYGLLIDSEDLFGEFADPYVTLYGTDSIVGRSIVVHKLDGSRWICSNLDYGVDVVTAVATFRYPLVGRVIFRQDANDPLSDTTVFVESLLYTDGTKNNSGNHRWYVHDDPIAKDFYNWTNRCFSVGPEYNPYEVSSAKGSNTYSSQCNPANAVRCTVGDMTSKSTFLSVAAKSDEINRTVLFYTDINLPLSGGNGILARSLVIRDDLAPDFRGNRMACATIEQRYPARAQVERWVRSGSESEINGRLEMEQAFDYDLTKTTLELRNLQRIASGYHVHEVSVPLELRFPCSNDAVHGHYNPFGVDPKSSPAPAMGSDDQYELGDLSGKYGTLDKQESISFEAIDTNLPVQGLYSIIGRSVVVHKKEQNQRWICGDVRPQINEKGASWIQAIASFHHPKGFAYGYIRFGQIKYADGSLSDTTVEVNLRHPGKNNRNVTAGHEWAVYVNQVGEDLAVKEYIARCLAAGFRWNPYLVKSDRDAYATDCNARNHLACEMGDLSGRHGKISVGGPRLVVTDSNLALSGNYSIMKKSVVIHEKNGVGLRFACANIEPDNDIVQTVLVKKTNRLIGDDFIDAVREAMAVPEWMMYLDSSEEQDIGKCLQFTIYFGGPDANRIQLDFDILMNTGKVERPYAVALGGLPLKKKPKKFPYEPCNTFSYNDNGTGKLLATSLLQVAIGFVIAFL